MPWLIRDASACDGHVKPAHCRGPLLAETEVTRRPRFGRDRVKSGHNSDIAEVTRMTPLRHQFANLKSRLADDLSRDYLPRLSVGAWCLYGDRSAVAGPKNV